jgi:O-antigen ligase
MTTLACAILALLLPTTIAGTNIALGLLSVAVVASRPRWERLKDPVFILLLAYVAAALVSALLCPAPAASLRAVLKDSHKVWALALFLLALRPDRRTALCLAAGFSFAAAIGVAQTIDWIPYVQHGWPYRAHAFVHPVTFGEQMALAVLGGLCFFDRKEAGLDSRKAKIVTAAFILLCAAALTLSRTRGAVVGLAVGIAAAALLDRRFLRWTPLIALGGIAFYLRSRGVDTNRPMATRDVLWDVAWRMFKDHHWTGAGPGRYRELFLSYHDGKLEGETPWGSAHNLYLHQLAERGILGGLALAALLGTMTWRAYFRARCHRNAWSLWAFTGIIAFLAMNFTEVAFQIEIVTTLFLLIWSWGMT